MRTSGIIVLAAAMTTSAIVSAQQTIYDGSASAIRSVISGKTCVGKGVLKFGESALGTAGTFERIGRPIGEYSIGYGTILIRRDGKLHSHVTSVSVRDHMLHLSTDPYRC